MKIDLRSYWFKSGFFTLMERGSMQVFRFLSFFFIVRGLTKTEFGIWSLYLTVATFIEMIRVGLIQNGLVRFLSVHNTPLDQREINTASLVLNLLHTALSALLLLAIGWVVVQLWDLQPLDQMLYIYIVTTCFLTPFYQFVFIQQAHLKFHGMFLSTFFRQGAFFTYVAYIYFFANKEYDLLHLTWGQAWAALLGALIAVLTGLPYAKFALYLKKSWLGELLNYGKYVVGTNLGITLIRTVDQFILGIIVSPAAVASYSTAMRVAHLVEVPIQSIAAIVFPQSARQMEEGGIPAVRRLYERSVGVILAMVIPGVLFVMLFPTWVLEFIASARYLDSVPVLQVVMLYALLLPFSRQFGTIMDAIGKPRLQFLLLMGGAVLNMGLNYVLISAFGLMGAAYATLSTYALIVIGSIIILRKEIQVSPMRTIGFGLGLYRNGFRLLLNLLRRKKSVDPPA